MVLESAVIPLMAHPRWVSISKTFSTELASRSGEETRFSTARMTPSPVWMPMAVVPS